jgi:hypothetical protein
MTSCSATASIRSGLHLLALVGAALAASGCAVVDGFGGDDDSSDSVEEEPDAGGAGRDAGDLEPDAGRAVECAAPSSMPFGMLTGGSATRTADFVAVFGSTELQPPRDIYQLELWQDILPFRGTVAPGSYVIGGPQTDYDTCGVCLLIYGDADELGVARQRYIAESGVVTIDFVDDFTITGSITQASLVSFDDGPRGACRTSVGPTMFNAIIQTP